ncbi:hypothetical protein EON65_39380 [archaeon]|nr:MAG: hypothetical protein EON65_39380 [archaeon]
MQRVPFDREASKNGDFAIPDETPEKVNEMYSAVLDHLLTPPQVKEGLMNSQSLEKKWQTVRMHQQLFEGGSNNNANVWGDRENVLLHNISKAKLPDLQSISRLKIILTSANRELMTSFLDSGGISVLLRAIEQRLISKPQTEVDIAIMYELLSCCKAIMNNDLGMDGFSTSAGAIDIVARCLKFDYKHFAILVSLNTYGHSTSKGDHDEGCLIYLRVYPRCWRSCQCAAITPRRPPA